MICLEKGYNKKMRAIFIFIFALSMTAGFGFCEQDTFEGEFNSILENFGALKKELSLTQDAYYRLKEEYSNLLKEYEDKFLDLFKKKREKGN